MAKQQETRNATVTVMFTPTEKAKLHEIALKKSLSTKERVTVSTMLYELAQEALLKK